MAKIFLAYRRTGEDVQQLQPIIQSICSAIGRSGNEYYCSFWNDDFYKENNFTKKDILEYALKQMDTCDAILVFIKSPEKSEGMLLEVGYAIAKNKKIILAIQQGITAVFLPEIATQTLTFTDVAELYPQLENLNLQ